MCFGKYNKHWVLFSLLDFVYVPTLSPAWPVNYTKPLQYVTVRAKKMCISINHILWLYFMAVHKNNKTTTTKKLRILQEMMCDKLRIAIYFLKEV